MAISAYVGLPGHGKSYGVVENIIIPALEKKRLIFTNIPMKEAAVFERFGINVIQFDVNDIKEDPDWWTNTFIDGAIFVLDEVPKLWPAGLKANGMRQSDRDFLAEHRHLVGDEGFSTEIVLVVQNLTMIAAFPRGLIETTFWVVKHIKMGANKRYRVDVYTGVMSGQSPQLAKREREIQGKFQPKVYDLYYSHTKSKNGVAGDETRVDGRFNMFKGASIKVGIIAFIVLAIAAYYGLKEVATMYAPEEKIDEVVAVQDGESTMAKIVKKKTGLLNKVDKILFSYSIKSRSDGVIKKVNTFKIFRGTTESEITESDLIFLGYTVKRISECLFRLTDDTYDDFVMCSKAVPDKGFFKHLVEGD